jgi:hypothetical protein
MIYGIQQKDILMKEVKRGPGRPPTLTPEARREQLRVASELKRSRAALSGKKRIDASVESSTKEFLEAYRDEHRMVNVGEAIDAIVSEHISRSDSAE